MLEKELPLRFYVKSILAKFLKIKIERWSNPNPVARIKSKWQKYSKLPNCVIHENYLCTKKIFNFINHVMSANNKFDIFCLSFWIRCILFWGLANLKLSKYAASTFLYILKSWNCNVWNMRWPIGGLIIYLKLQNISR